MANVPFSEVGGATKENPFPDSRKGSLDGEPLAKPGLGADGVKEDDRAPGSLFFPQPLLPICEQLGMDGDPCRCFCAQVAQQSNLRAVGELDLGCGTGHDHMSANLQELVHWDGVPMKDGVRGHS